MTFAEELRQQRWDDHRYYHHNRVNQSLHLASALCFVTSYVLLFIHPAAAVFVGWLLAMVLRQTGHFFFEPQTYDAVNQATHAYKESVKVGYNLHRKVVLLSIWIAAPLVLAGEPTLFGLLEAPSGARSFLDNLASVWLVIGLGAVLFRTVHLFFLKGVQSGLVWCTKILTDPFHDIKIYHKAPYYMLKGEMYDDMSQWYDDSVRASMA
ncbi:MAG TPA: hypothetical protein VMW56_16505 [Candidatus Margulisiibacteriota bacterium]|nr:hypothetical protein [Candidatus Margulisiibacteriota bacterium]